MNVVKSEETTYWYVEKDKSWNLAAIWYVEKLFDMLRRIAIWYVESWKWRNNLLICWEG